VGAISEEYAIRRSLSQVASRRSHSEIPTSTFCFGLTRSTRVQSTAPDNRSECITKKRGLCLRLRFARSNGDGDRPSEHLKSKSLEDTASFPLAGNAARPY
jgi:hypothetical protein